MLFNHISCSSHQIFALLILSNLISPLLIPCLLYLIFFILFFPISCPFYFCLSSANLISFYQIFALLIWSLFMPSLGLSQTNMHGRSLINTIWIQFLKVIKSKFERNYGPWWSNLGSLFSAGLVSWQRWEARDGRRVSVWAGGEKAGQGGAGRPLEALHPEGAVHTLARLLCGPSQHRPHLQAGHQRHQVWRVRLWEGEARK